MFLEYEFGIWKGGRIIRILGIHVSNYLISVVGEMTDEKYKYSPWYHVKHLVYRSNKKITGVDYCNTLCTECLEMKVLVVAACLVLGFVICSMAETSMERSDHPDPANQESEVIQIFTSKIEIFHFWNKVFFVGKQMVTCFQP